MRTSREKRGAYRARSAAISSITLTAELHQKAKAIFIRELGPGNYTRDRHQWLGEENAQSLHERATQLAPTRQLHRPAGAKLFTPKD